MISSSLIGSRTWPGGSNTSSEYQLNGHFTAWYPAGAQGREVLRGQMGRPGRAGEDVVEHSQGVASPPAHLSVLGFLQAVEFIDDDDRHEQVNRVFPDLQQRPEIQILQLALVLDVEAGVRVTNTPCLDQRWIRSSRALTAASKASTRWVAISVPVIVPAAERSRS
jgi:hypothetical protein